VSVGQHQHRLRYLSRFLRLLPPGARGKARLARAALGSALKARDVQLRDRYGCHLVVPSLHEPIGFHLLVDAAYEPEALEFVLDRLQPGGVFVDVGANIGVFTIPAAKKVGPMGQVLAIEPSAHVFPYLEVNVCRNEIGNVRLKQCAAWHQDAPALPFYEAPFDHFGMGSLAPQFFARATRVPAQALDHMIRGAVPGSRVDVLKVDVEGFEAAVFRGAEQLLSRDDAPLILFEFCDWAEARTATYRVGDAQRLLRSWGYAVWELRDYSCGRPPLADVLATGFASLVAAKRCAPGAEP
jgi:FkbM family methyltransferase